MSASSPARPGYFVRARILSKNYPNLYPWVLTLKLPIGKVQPINGPKPLTEEAHPSPPASKGAGLFRRPDMQTIRHKTALDESIERRTAEIRQKEQNRAMEMHRDAAGRACCSEAFDDGFNEEKTPWWWGTLWFALLGALIAYAWLGE
jgi:hypothetical protein